MRSRLYFTAADSGFIFPAVLFYTTAILLLLLAGIQMYESEQQITHNLIGQLKGETILQMNKHEMEKEFKSSRPESGTVRRFYQYPQGSADVTLRESSKTIYTAEQHVWTDTGVYQLYTSVIPVPPPSEKTQTEDDEKSDKPDVAKDTELSNSAAMENGQTADTDQ